MASLSQDGPTIHDVRELNVAPELSRADSSAKTRHRRILACAFSFIALAVSLAYSYYFVFSRPMSLDEGYLMVTVQGFNSGHALYDTVFTQYGPLYYFYEWLLRPVLS